MEDLILKDYQMGISGIELAKKYELKSHQVYYILKKNNIETRSNKENSRIYNIDFDFFKTIDTEAKAYWLGFIFADGSLGIYGRGKDEYTFKLDLAKRDSDHLEKFNKSTHSNHPISFYSNKSIYSKTGFVEYCRVKVISERFCQHLIDKGCVQNKTHSLTRPPIEDQELIRHFIRGFVDGDGSIKMHKQTKAKYVLSINGTKDMLEWITESLPRPGAIQVNESISSTTCHFDNVEYLYNNAELYLERKYGRYIKGIENKKSNQLVEQD